MSDKKYLPKMTWHKANFIICFISMCQLYSHGWYVFGTIALAGCVLFLITKAPQKV